MYYGNPETLKAATESLRELSKDPEAFLDYVQKVDGFASLAIETVLGSILSTWPVPDSTNKNAISLMWLYKMVELMKKFKTSANTIGATDSEADWAKVEYDALVSNLRNGRVYIPNAVYMGYSVKESAGMASLRLVTQDESEVTPMNIDNLFLRGLRQ